VSPTSHTPLRVPVPRNIVAHGYVTIPITK